MSQLTPNWLLRRVAQLWLLLRPLLLMGTCLRHPVLMVLVLHGMVLLKKSHLLLSCARRIQLLVLHLKKRHRWLVLLELRKLSQTTCERPRQRRLVNQLIKSILRSFGFICTSGWLVVRRRLHGRDAQAVCLFRTIGSVRCGASQP